MISKHSLFVILFGWLIVVTYIYYDYGHHQADLFKHFLSAKTPADVLFHIIIIGALIGSHVTAYLINERKKLLNRTKFSEERLEHAANEWKVTFDSIPYGVLLTDNTFNIIRANKYIENLSGVPVKELITGKKCYDMVCRLNKPGGCNVHETLGHNQTKSLEYHDEEKGIIFNESITPLSDGKGEITTFVHVLIDITDSKEKERKLSRSKDAFFNMLKDLDSAYKELKGVHDSLIVTFSNIIDAKSSWTRGHSIDVASYATAIAREMGLNEREVETLRTAALLHDIGKIGTYDGILDKPEELDDGERNLIRLHTIKGEDILSPIKGLRKIVPIVRSHHERVDGKGYPDGLKGDEIHLLAKIICVADSYDAMISDRPYRASRGMDYAMAEIKRCSGTQFDSDVSETFLKILGRGPENPPTA